MSVDMLALFRGTLLPRRRFYFKPDVEGEAVASAVVPKLNQELFDLFERELGHGQGEGRYQIEPDDDGVPTIYDCSFCPPKPVFRETQIVWPEVLYPDGQNEGLCRFLTKRNMDELLRTLNFVDASSVGGDSSGLNLCMITVIAEEFGTSPEIIFQQQALVFENAPLRHRGRLAPVALVRLAEFPHYNSLKHRMHKLRGARTYGKRAH